MSDQTTSELAWATANVLASGTVFFICFCRAIATDKHVLKRVRAKFALLGTAFVMFGVSPVWGQYPGALGFFVSVSVVIGLLAETYQWGKGAPDSVKFEHLHDDKKEQS